jgi:hypothetical protein
MEFGSMLLTICRALANGIWVSFPSTLRCVVVGLGQYQLGKEGRWFDEVASRRGQDSTGEEQCGIFSLFSASQFSYISLYFYNFSFDFYYGFFNPIWCMSFFGCTGIA